MQLTWLDSNSWLINIAGLRILLDPWLVDSLVFGNLPWLFEGKKRTLHQIPENIDFILLSQGLEDHAHPPTLKILDHNLPVIASENGAKICQDLGYAQIKTLKHGESYIFENKIEIMAIAGSPVGPNLVENGYIIRDLSSDESIYYEPHGFHCANLQRENPVKVIITPLTNIKIPLIGPVIKGQENAVEVCRWLKPQYILSTAAAGDLEYKGLLTKILKEEGTIDNFRTLLTQAHLNTKVIEPQPWATVTIDKE
ncbi:MAG: MBL fold metallo-hydrolase [Cyanobacteria bacterium]|nr:MBL fold metallo-hydrolase [Cyanobacteria bacterium CG_2015-16_32_12]NCO77748.1 MBL fold metallo-hydrolase [Cyanobacteria bacterium CG_2015-22_32_23]NCQ42115.1 MBL fold metallo-hydrolase [Cyanobacteria bacterium CG_2015-04_32_10]NCS83574.1 MBL fold metallo-hydrolase [Cyanobacteria bacterium CG_2015-02_32_10]